MWEWLSWLWRRVQAWFVAEAEEVTVAIAYGSQGAGAGTEANGVSLDLVCPAAVAANDILIAHTTFEGLTNAPSTPANWTLLYAAANLGTGTAIGRSWVFGKIADGTEDGATIGFGTHANTSGRYGRIYSFTGWTSGTITQVVSDFTDVPTETSIPLPTVTTRAAGALAVALLVQDDNNSFAAAGAQTGGTWAEPVAEFVSTTLGAQGCCVGIQTCTPTADPGTVSGGTANATADEGSSIGFSIYPSPAPAFTDLAVTLTESVWNVATTPKTVVVPAMVDDYLFVIAGGDTDANVSAVTSSTTAGSTGAWTEIREQVSGTHCWYSSAWAQVTANGSITVQVAATGATTEWGFYVLRARASGGVGDHDITTTSATEVVNLTVAEGSAVGFLSVDFSTGSAGTGWTPTADVTLVERGIIGGFTLEAAYWVSQTAGTRDYGSTGAGGTEIDGLALEIKALVTGDLTGAVTATTTTTSTVTAVVDRIGAITATETAGNTVTAVVNRFATITATTTAGSTVTGSAGGGALTGDVDSTVTAGSTVSGAVAATGAVSATTTAGGAVTAAVGRVGAVSATETTGSTVAAVVGAVGAVISSTTAGGTVTGVINRSGAVTATTTAGATVTGSTVSGLIGTVTSTTTAGSTVTALVARVGSVTSTTTAGVITAAVVARTATISAGTTATSTVVGIRAITAVAVTGTITAASIVTAAVAGAVTRGQITGRPRPVATANGRTRPTAAVSARARAIPTVSGG